MINVEIANNNHLRPQLNYAFYCACSNETVTIFMDISFAEFRLNRTEMWSMRFTFRIKVLFSLHRVSQNSHLFKSMTWRFVCTSPKQSKKYELYM
jgi:hypothetical protein